MAGELSVTMATPSQNQLAQSGEEVGALHQLCREGRVYDVERWIREGRPLQIDPASLRKGTRPKTALEIALETGQHSLTFLLLSNGYRLELERYRPLDLALERRRWDLFDLLLAWGADLRTTDVYTVLTTYNADLYERFMAAGYDLTQRHEMASVLGYGTSNRPLLGFAKRHRLAQPNIQRELNLALGYQVKEGSEKGVNLCLWAGADAHAHVSEYDPTESDDPSDQGWSAVERAAYEGRLKILERFCPEPRLDNFDELYRNANGSDIVVYLATIQSPKDLTSILNRQLWWVATTCPFTPARGTSTVETLLDCKVRWEESDFGDLADIRRLLLAIEDYKLKVILSCLKRREVCATEIYHELTRTPGMQKRLQSLGLVKRT